MGIIAVIIIFICISVDNLVSANMSAVKMSTKIKNLFSIKAALTFGLFNVVLFVVGYIFSFLFHSVFVQVHNWVAFSFIFLLGIKMLLESIEKSPSFTDEEAYDNKKLMKVSALLGMNAFMVGFAVETMNKSWFPHILILFVITFLLTILGFHLGTRYSKMVVGKKVEFVSGIILVFMAIRLIII